MISLASFSISRPSQRMPTSSVTRPAIPQKASVDSSSFRRGTLFCERWRVVRALRSEIFPSAVLKTDVK